MRPNMLDFNLRAEGDALEATTLAKRLLLTRPDGLVRQRTAGKRQLNARSVRQTDPLASMAQLLSRSSSLSHCARARSHRTPTSTLNIR